VADFGAALIEVIVSGRNRGKIKVLL